MSKIVWFGDSHFNPSYISNDQLLYPYLVSIANGYAPANIVNLGVPGDETADGLAKIQDVKDESPDVVVLNYLANDKEHGVSVATYKTNLEAIIDDLQGEGYKVVLMTPPMCTGQAHVNGNIYEAYWEYVIEMQILARAKGCEFIDLFSHMSIYWFKEDVKTKFKPKYYNTLHLSTQGHQYIADYMATGAYDGVFTV